MINNNKVTILNMNFNSIRANELLNIISERVNHAEKTFVVTANPEIVMHGRNDPTYLNLVNQADFVIADGYGDYFRFENNSQCASRTNCRFRLDEINTGKGK